MREEMKALETVARSLSLFERRAIIHVADLTHQIDDDESSYLKGVLEFDNEFFFINHESNVFCTCSVGDKWFHYSSGYMYCPTTRLSNITSSITGQ